MASVKVDVVHPNGIDCARNATLPTDKPSGRVARKLAEMMKIPYTDDHFARFGFLNERNARRLARDETLADAGVLEGDTLRLVVMGRGTSW